MRSSAEAGQICRQLTDGDGPAILVADFQAFNGAPRLSQLLSDAAPDRRIYQLDPLGALTGERRYAAVPEMAEESAAAFESSETSGQQVFVVGHCSATGLGIRVANLLAGTRDVTAVLVQPSWPGTEHVTERFAEFQGKLGASGRACPDLEGDPQDCVAGIEKIFRTGLVDLATRLDLDPDQPAFTDLLTTYRGWVSFLLACRNDQPAQIPADGVTVSVLTDEPGFVLPGTAPGRCRITPPPPLEKPDAVTPELAKLVLEQLG
ncbi:hypothetical protein [Jatrophihabitans sp.]|uniref:hypothetical protein n=1 Tax=Jatrophihabitans sp. TaxID=1932789 RepID=UPI002D19F515|nr:hypothetical protein [Jatrophihabitans sp.]